MTQVHENIKKRTCKELKGKAEGRKQETADISSIDLHKTNMISEEEENCYHTMTMLILKCLLLWKKKVLTNSMECDSSWKLPVTHSLKKLSTIRGTPPLNSLPCKHDCTT
jgi:hypothetical protein